MVRWRSTRIEAFVVAVLMVATVGAAVEAAQLDPDVRDRVLPAAVQIAVLLETTESGQTRAEYVPVGSGTVVSSTGLILTNWHVVDAKSHRAQLDMWEAQAASSGESLAFVLNTDEFLILTTEGTSEPEPAFVARVQAEHDALDLAVLQITADAFGVPVEPAGLDLPFVPLGDTSDVRHGNPIHVFAYPVAGGGSLQYTEGVVSGFDFEEGIAGPAWITTDATMAGGSSGGTAVDADGRLVGVPTQGSQLDCRPGDTNLDGTVDAADVGCIPVGGSIGQLRPINLAHRLLVRAGLDSALIDASAQDPTIAAVATAIPAMDTSPTPVPVDVANEADALIDATAPDAASYVYAEDYCRTGPVYPPGTRLILLRDVYGDAVHDWASTRYSPPIPAGSEVEITGPYVENGVCDLWPLRFHEGNVVGLEILVSEWDLSPDFPNQVPPLPPERRFVTGEVEGLCRSNPSYADGDVLVVSHESPLYFHRRGYPFSYLGQVAAGTEVEITGPPMETGVCDMWPVTYAIPPSALADAGRPLTEEELIYGQSVSGYIHVSDMRPTGERGASGSGYRFFLALALAVSSRSQPPEM